jgi:hypothetical protein
VVAAAQTAVIRIPVLELGHPMRAILIDKSEFAVQGSKQD